MTRKSITVNTNDPSNRRVKLTVQATIDLQLECSPKRLWFGRLPHQADPVTLSAKLTGSMLDSVVISDLHIERSVPENAFIWKFKDNRSGGGDLSLDVTLYPPRLIPGKFNYVLTLDTNLEHTPHVFLNLSGELSGLLTATPPRLLFGNYEPGIPMEEPIELQSSDSRAFRIKEIFPGDPEISVVFQSDLLSVKHSLVVHLNPLEDRPRFETQIKIITDLESDSDILLDVHGFQKRIPKKITPRAVY